jgi:hypothetical protein
VGHIRLGQLPRTRKWRDVVELVAVGADVSQVANATIRAADSAFSFVNNDSWTKRGHWGELGEWRIGCRTSAGGDRNGGSNVLACWPRAACDGNILFALQ